MVLLRSSALIILFVLLGSGCEPATLSELQEDILTPSCALEGCHSTFLPARDLDLSVGVSYAALVDVPAQEPGYTLVVPGDPEGSLLYQVLLDDIATVGQMPPRVGNSAGLSQQYKAAVRSWIADGAQDN